MNTSYTDAFTRRSSGFQMRSELTGNQVKPVSDGFQRRRRSTHHYMQIDRLQYIDWLNDWLINWLIDQLIN